MPMMTRSRARLAGLLLVLGLTTGLYFWKIGDTPTLTRDEAFLGLNGYSIATTGHDLDRLSHPLYLRAPIEGSWWSPILPYTIAGEVTVMLGLSETTVRTPMALAAILNVLLVFFIGRLLFAE